MADMFRSNWSCPAQDLRRKKPGVDPAKNCEQIKLLTYKTFYQFMRSKDAALVLFYNSDNECKSAEEAWYKMQLIGASKITKRPNTAFAAVDCGGQKLLCCKEEVPCNPLVRLYSGEKAIGNIKNKNDINPKKLSTIIENCARNDEGGCE